MSIRVAYKRRGAIIMKPRTLGAEKLKQYLRDNRIAAVDFAKIIGVRNVLQIYRYTGKSNTIPKDETKKAIAKATKDFVAAIDWFRLYVGKEVQFKVDEE